MNFIIISIVICIWNVLYINCDISDKRLCGDPTCSAPISKAKTILRYQSIEPQIFSFPPNVELTIYSKSAGSRIDLWGAEYNGKRGYVPVSFIRETKIITNKLNFLVPTEGHENEIENEITVSNEQTESLKDPVITQTSDVKATASTPTPNKVLEPYEYIDGTRIPIDESYLTPDNTGETVNETINKDHLKLLIEEKEPQLINNDNLLKTNEIDNLVNIDSPNIADFKILETNTNIESEKSSVKQDNPSELVSDRLKSGNIEMTKNDLSAEDDESGLSIEDDEDIDDEDIDDENDSEDDEDEVEDISSSKTLNLDTPGGTNNELKIEENSDSKIVENDDLKVDQNLDINTNIDNTGGQNDEQIPEVSSKEFDLNNDVHLNEQNEINTLSHNKTETQNDIPGSSVNTLDSEITQQNNLILEHAHSHQNILNELGTSDTSSKQSINSEVVNEDITNTDTEVENQSPLDKLLNNFDNVTPNIDYSTEHSNVEISTERSNSIEESKVTEVPLEVVSSPLNTFEKTTTETFATTLNGVSNDATVDKSSYTEEQVTESPGFFSGIFDYATKETVVTTETIPITDDTLVNVLQTEQPADSNLKESLVIDTEEPILSNYKSGFDVNIPKDNNDQTELNVAENNDVVETLQNPSTDTHIPENLNSEVNSMPEATESSGFFGGFYGMFGSSTEDSTEKTEQVSVSDMGENKQNEFVETTHVPFDQIKSDTDNNCQVCTVSSSECPEDNAIHQSVMDFPASSYDTFVYLAVTAITVLIFTLGYYYIEKMRQDGTLIGKINELEKALLVSSKECIILKEDLQYTKDKLVCMKDVSSDSNETVQALKSELEEVNNIRSELEEQVSNLEKELETATEAGLELNRMLTDFLSSQNGSDTLIQSVERLQAQLNEQQHVISDMNSTISSKNTENELLQSEILSANEKVVILQQEVDKLVENLLSLQKEKTQIEEDLEERMKNIQQELDTTNQLKQKQVSELSNELKKVQSDLKNVQRLLDIKENEFTILQDNIKQLKEGGKDVNNILELSQCKAELQHTIKDRDMLIAKIRNQESDSKVLEERAKETNDLITRLKGSFDDAEKEKIEAQMRLEVLSSYFKEREVQLQKELARHEDLWLHNQGEANSTVERMKALQEELQNYKFQNEMLKKEIVDQEVSLKSQISVLEKKAHENWLLSRQAERRLEESKQEASQLRNRLTIVEKNLTNSNELTDESKTQYRVLSPLNTNGDLRGSPLHMPGVEASASPPLLFPPREHMTTSPPLPFMGLPPPPGVPFMPPPPGVPFMPPPALYPGDRRPPPLGRMSSPPPPSSTFSPNRTFSPYDRDNSPPRFPSSRPYGSPDSPYRDMDDYRHMSPPPPINQYDHPDTRADWDGPNRSMGHRPKSGRQKSGASKNNV